MTLFYTALVSVGVSAVVTLAIEWFAKPILESRKERILARAKIKREVSASAVLGWYRFDQARLPLELADNEAYERVRATVSEAQYLLTDRFDREAMFRITQGVLYAGISEQESTREGARETIHQAIELLHTPWWRPRRRTQLLERLVHALEDLKATIHAEFPQYIHEDGEVS
jgi:hypothetical protein